MKHRIIGLIVLIATLVVGTQFFLEYQNTNRRPGHLQMRRSPPIPPLTEKMIASNPAPAIQSADELMQKHFNETVDTVPVVSAWSVQVASLSTEKAAQSLMMRVRALGFDAFILPVVLQGQSSFRVNAGPFTQQQDAIAAISAIQGGLKITGILKQYTPGDLQDINSPLP